MDIVGDRTLKGDGTFCERTFGDPSSPKITIDGPGVTNHGTFIYGPKENDDRTTVTNRNDTARSPRVKQKYCNGRCRRYTTY